MFEQFEDDLKPNFISDKKLLIGILTSRRLREVYLLCESPDFALFLKVPEILKYAKSLPPFYAKFSITFFFKSP
jgi:hypothetical protein